MELVSRPIENILSLMKQKNLIKKTHDCLAALLKEKVMLHSGKHGAILIL